jgi:hypothetical protein
MGTCVQANIPITIVEGGTFNKTYQWKVGDPAVPVDLTGYTANMQVRAKLKDTEALLTVPFQTDEFTPDGPTGIYLITDDPEEDVGKWRVYLRDDDTLGICGNHKDIAGVYDLFLYNPEAEAVLKMYGVATIVAAVTREA